MNRYLLDTNIALAYLRGHALYQQIENDLQLADPSAVILFSVVSKAELLSLGEQNEWGAQKMGKLASLLQRFVIIDINEADHVLLEAYAQIDAYSQGKLANKSLENSARNMGKNDLWIAATAHVTKSNLITTVGDVHVIVAKRVPELLHKVLFEHFF